MTIATGPSIGCPSGSAPVAVIATDGVLPIQNARVSLFLTYSAALIVFDSKQSSLTTGIDGLAEICVENRLTKSYAVEAWIQKSNVDFGSGLSEIHRIGSVSGLSRVAMPFTLFKAVAAPMVPAVPEPPILPEITQPTIPSLPTPQPPPSVCTAWNTVANPNVPSALSSSFPISVSGAKWDCPSLNTSELINGMGKIEYGGRTFDLPIQNGYGRVNLEDVMDLSNLTGIPSAPIAPTVVGPVTAIPPSISPAERGSTTVTLYLADYIRNKIYTPIKGAYWGAGFHDRKNGQYEIHKATDARGTGDTADITCQLNVPKQYGDYTVTIQSVQNLGTPTASYTVKIEL